MSTGAGKSTLSRAIVEEIPSFTRVSIDQIQASRHGLYGIDYPPSQYAEFQDEADKIYVETVHKLLEEKKNIVLDRSFYAKEDRDDYRAKVEKAGGRVVLVYLKADRDLLWRRICERRAKGVNADSALEIDESLLDRYVNGFEAPDGEGEIVITVQ